MTGFLKKIPVRRQTAIKSAAKTLSRIKKLLQAYAMARPGTRLSLKVLNSKTDKDNWTYAPSLTASIVDASRKVVGVETTGQCISRIWPEDVEETDLSVKLLACLPKPDAGKLRSTDILRCAPVLTVTDCSKIGGSNQYISVDGRPLSPDRGTANEIIKLYKSYIRSMAKAKGILTVNDPFLNLHISCLPAAYDVNVEPAKDDVLFADKEQLLHTIEDLFQGTYGVLQKASEPTEKVPTSVQGFNVLLRQPVLEEPVSPPASNQLPALTNQSRTSENLFSTPHATFLTSDGDELSQPGSPETGSNDNGLNPWSIAKTHFFHRSPKSHKVSQFATPTRPDLRLSGGRNAASTQSSPPAIASPYSPSSPEDSQFLPRGSSSSSTRGGRGSHGYSKASRERDRERYGNGSLDTWFGKITGSTLPNASPGDIANEDSGTESVMLDDLDDDNSEHSSRVANKPLKLPLPSNSNRNQQSQLLLSPNPEPSDVQSEKRQEFPVMEEWSARLHQDFLGDQSAFSSQDTERALDFERRKKEANIAHRRQLRHEHLASPTSSQPASNSPHKNRYLAARAALSDYSRQSQTGQPQKVRSNSSIASTMQENDPRTYMMRHESDLGARGSDASKLKRIPTNRLPLENIPKEFDVHNLGAKFGTSVVQLKKNCKYLTGIDHYVSGKDRDMKYSPFDPVDEPNLPEMCKIWERVIAQSVKEKYRTKEVDLYDAAGGSDEAIIERIDIYGAIKLKLLN